jgi:hypothetical protein
VIGITKLNGDTEAITSTFQLVTDSLIIFYGGTEDISRN